MSEDTLLVSKHRVFTIFQIILNDTQLILLSFYVGFIRSQCRRKKIFARKCERMNRRIRIFSCRSKISRKDRRVKVHASPAWWGPRDFVRNPVLQGHRTLGGHDVGAPGRSLVLVIHTNHDRRRER